MTAPPTVAVLIVVAVIAESFVIATELWGAASAESR
jgi:hypothetical protein